MEDVTANMKSAASAMSAVVCGDGSTGMSPYGCYTASAQ
jgi:hypothetical protein